MINIEFDEQSMPAFIEIINKMVMENPDFLKDIFEKSIKSMLSQIDMVKLFKTEFAKNFESFLNGSISSEEMIDVKLSLKPDQYKELLEFVKNKNGNIEILGEPS